MKRPKVLGGLYTSAAIWVFYTTAPVSAQEAQQSSRTELSEDDQDNQDDEESIVVTGSRLITNGNNSPTPVTVVTTEVIQQTTPSNIPDALNRLPVFSGSNNQSSFGAAERNFSGNYLNLRNVGAGRSLILFDGHRFPPTTSDGLVDINTVPQMLIQRVEVVTGGASAVYGSDAITGVVNFIVDPNFSGLKLNAQAGVSTYGDNESYRIGAATGTDLFDGRGHIEGSLEHYDSAGIDDKLGRPYGRLVYSTQGAGTVENPYRLVTNSRLTNFSRFGIIKTGIFADQVFGGPNDTLRPFAHGTPTGTQGVESGGDGTFYNSTLQAVLRSTQAFGRFDYDVSDTTHFYVQATATKSFNQFSKEESVINNLTFSSENPLLAAEYRAALAAANEPTFRYAKQITEAPRLTPTAWINSYVVIAALEGSLGAFDWQTAYTHGVARQKVATLNNVALGRFYAGLDAVRAPDGSIVCNVTLTNPGLYPGCVPIDPFGEDTITQEAQDYFFQDTYYRLRNTMDNFTASIAGSPFSTWAGPVRAALSGEYRILSMDLVSDAQPTEKLDCTGLRFGNCTARTLLYSSNVVGDQRNQEQRITEGAIEVDVPLLEDFAIAQSLNVNGAARFTHYNTSGDVVTWKVGVDWHLTDDLRIRATRSRDIRAPNLSDLYSPVNVNPSGFNDLHTGVTATVPVESSGNPNLEPEVARTITVGAVYRPSWLSGFSIAVDYYDIMMTNAIGFASASNSAVQRECEASNGTSVLCDLFERPLPFSDRSPANFPTRAFSRRLNAAFLEVRGVDAEVNYSGINLGSGTLSLRTLVAWQPVSNTANFSNSPITYRAGAAGLPEWRVTGFLNYDLDAVAVNILQRWHSSTRRSGNRDQVFDAPPVAARAYTDLTLSYRLPLGLGRDDSHAQMFLTIQNLFNQQPSPYLATGPFSTVPGFFVPVTNGDDPIGRYFTAGVRIRL
jgi:outer membrane receptor protein involved in Fe transport